MSKQPFPRQVTRVHQIEITSRCSLRCVYCPSPDIMRGKYPNRPALDMGEAIFESALAHVRYCVANYGQDELNLAGIGESTLHPNFVEWVGRAREALPQGKLIFATNGVPVKGTPSEDIEVLARALAPYRPEVWVSAHRPEKAGLAVEAYKAAGILGGVSVDPTLNANDWAGQVDWHNSTAGIMPCWWLIAGRVMVMADGRITACCLDAKGSGVVGHVDDPPGTLKTRPYDLCPGCHHFIGAEGWDQAAGKAIDA